MAWEELYLAMKYDINKFDPIILIGKSGAGKDTTAKELEKDFGFTRIVEYTTRAKRSYEVDGVDYHFITTDEFDKMNDNGEFVSASSFKRIQNGVETTVYYGIKKDDIKHGTVIATNPYNMMNIKSNIKYAKVVYINVPEIYRIKRLRRRGDDINEIKRRTISDNKDFTEDVISKCNIIVTNGTMWVSGKEKHPKTIAKEIIKRLGNRK